MIFRKKAVISKRHANIQRVVISHPLNSAEAELSWILLHFPCFWLKINLMFALVFHDPNLDLHIVLSDAYDGVMSPEA